MNFINPTHKVDTNRFKPGLVLLFVICAAGWNAMAQNNEEAAVLATVEAFFSALANRDRAALEAVTFPGSLNISTSTAADGSIAFTVRNHEEMVTALSRPGGRAIERYWDATVLIHGEIAVFWAPYDFHIDSEYSHCGIDSFQLIKREGKWLLSNLSWTIERGNCAPSPLGPLTH
jgi:hypothetical protein